MENKPNKAKNNNIKKSSIFKLLKPYLGSIIGLALLAILASGLGLLIPKIISRGIDTYIHHTFVLRTFILEFGAVAFFVFVFTYLQSIVQTFASERVAKDLRRAIAEKISNSTYAFVEKTTPAKLLTNLTSDIDSIKMFVGQAISSILSSIIIVIGAAILLLTIDWKLALAVLCIIPVLGVIFFFVFTRLRILMKKSREVIDWLNNVINESILGSALIRVLNSQSFEFDKFVKANTEAKSIGMQILRIFAGLIPLITFIANFAILIILVLGGHYVIAGAMSLGDFTAFNSYIALLIFPVLIIGIMTSVISQSQASYDRIREVLDAEDDISRGKIKKELQGRIEFKNVFVSYGEKNVLKDISFTIEPRTRTSIIGPTAAGKSQILYLLTHLISPSSGEILIDGEIINDYDAQTIHRQIGFVFQASIIFNLTLRENISFGGLVNEADFAKAIATSELDDFIASLPQGLETIISERGMSLSGGQKQRIMLARALALNPKILLLDDFTARVDSQTEKKILENLAANYQTLTLVSVTQKITAVEDYDQIILVMEGEMIATGMHAELLATSPEYDLIYDSQKSTNTYE